MKDQSTEVTLQNQSSLGDSPVKKGRKKQESNLDSSKISLVPNTPFACVERGTNDFVIVFGKNLITEQSFPSKAKATAWCNQIDWNTVLNVVGIYVEHALKSVNNE